jgi:tetratricopeptide (TPR) repeat protein
LHDQKSLSALWALLLFATAFGYPLELSAQLPHAGPPGPPATALDPAARLEDDMQRGTALFEAERFEEALPHLRRIWDARPASPEQESEASLLCEGELGGALFQLGRYDEARPILTWVLGPLKQMHGLDETTAELSMLLGMLLGNEQSLQEAEPLLSDAYEFYSYIPALATSENAANAARALSQLRYQQGRGTDSEALALESLRIVNKLRGNTVGLRVGALFVLGQAYGLEGRFKDAEANELLAMNLLPMFRNGRHGWRLPGKRWERSTSDGLNGSVHARHTSRRCLCG